MHTVVYVRPLRDVKRCLVANINTIASTIADTITATPQPLSISTTHHENIKN